MIVKKRYYYCSQQKVAEFDIFLKMLSGLITVEFEFKNRTVLNRFQPPKFCLVDITEDEFVAGGMLAGKNYQRIEKELHKYGYKKINYHL